MSYSFSMYFLPCGSFNRALNKAHQFCELMKSNENIRKIIESGRFYFPSQRSCSPKTDMEKHFAHEADRRSLDGFFTLNFVYFHKAKLLALVGYSYPEADKFFKKNIGFQNSCEQDYERSHWKGIKLFENIWDECANLTAEDIFSSMSESERQFYTVKEIQEKLEYQQRSTAYDRIYKMMKLDKWLWGHDDEDFTRFSMNVLNSQELHYLAERYVMGLFH